MHPTIQLRFITKLNPAFVRNLLKGGLLLLVIASSLRLIPIDHWSLHLFSHFPVQYGVIGLGLSLVLFKLRSLKLGILALVIACWNLSIFLDYPLIPESSHIPDSAIKVYFSNISYHNDDLEALKQEVRNLTADIALFVEVTRDLYQAFHPSLPAYPYQLKWLAEPEDAGGYLLVSRYPITSHEVLKKETPYWMPILVANLMIGHRPVTLYGAHIVSPLLVWNYPIRKEQFDRVTRHIKSHSNPVLLMGDLNTTPFVADFQQFIRNTDLIDSRKGKGWIPSWPTAMPLFGIAIDHILTNSQLKTFAVTTGPFIGSDHFPMTSYIGFNDESHSATISYHPQPAQQHSLSLDTSIILKN